MKETFYILGVDTSTDKNPSYKYFTEFVGTTSTSMWTVTSYEDLNKAQEAFGMLDKSIANQQARLREAVEAGVVSDYDTHYPAYILSAVERNSLQIMKVTVEVKPV